MHFTQLLSCLSTWLTCKCKEHTRNRRQNTTMTKFIVRKRLNTAAWHSMRSVWVGFSLPVQLLLNCQCHLLLVIFSFVSFNCLWKWFVQMCALCVCNCNVWLPQGFIYWYTTGCKKSQLSIKTFICHFCNTILKELYQQKVLPQFHFITNLCCENEALARVPLVTRWHRRVVSHF